MKVVALGAAAFNAAADDSQGPSAGAMQKAIDMLMDMAAKVKQEKNDEQVAFSKFGTFCAMEEDNLKKEIATDAEEIEMLTTEIAELNNEAKTLGEEIAQLETNVEGFEAETVSKKKQRAKDNTEFLSTEQDFAESVDAIKRALDSLAAESHDRPAAAAALTQLSDKNRLPSKVQAIVASFVTMSGMDDDASPPEANAYEAQSGGIVDLLKKLQDDFRAKLSETQKAEMNSVHAFDMIIQDLTDSISFAKKDISEKSKEKNRKEAKSASDAAQLAATQDVKAQSEKTLSEMSTSCSQKSLSFDEKQQLREEEIEAIAQAVQILGAPDVAGQHEKHFQLIQKKKQVATALAQLRSDASTPRRKVREFLEAEGKRLKSNGLELLAEKIAADPFAKVKKMIDGMITRLLEEANSDAQHEGFCDAEIGKSKITRTKLGEDIDALHASVEDGKATIAHLTNRIAELSAQVASLDQAMNEAASLRATESENNAVTVAEAKQAQEKVVAATAVLKDFYAKALQTTALVQTAVKSNAEGIKIGSDEWVSLANPAFEGSGGYTTGIAGKVDKGHKAGMQTFGETYQGNQDANAGVMALLEVILSDFANLEADTTAAEAEAKRAHENFITKSEKNKAVAEKQSEMDTADKASAEQTLQMDTADWKATQDELLAAERYHAKLVPQCMDPGQTFEERTAARESEIASLKEALSILGNSDIA